MFCRTEGDWSSSAGVLGKPRCGASTRDVGFSACSSSKLAEAELGQAVSLETSFLSFISSPINQESDK